MGLRSPSERSVSVSVSRTRREDIMEIALQAVVVDNVVIGRRVHSIYISLLARIYARVPTSDPSLRLTPVAMPVARY